MLLCRRAVRTSLPLAIFHLPSLLYSTRQVGSVQFFVSCASGRPIGSPGLFLRPSLRFVNTSALPLAADEKRSPYCKYFHLGIGTGSAADSATDSAASNSSGSGISSTLNPSGETPTAAASSTSSAHKGDGGSSSGILEGSIDGRSASADGSRGPTNSMRLLYEANYREIGRVRSVASSANTYRYR